MFSTFEWMMAMRYLRARRQEGFISVIAGFSFVGIMLGVATLIIVMSVMNGFRTELLSHILGLNGHMFVRGVAGYITDYGIERFYRDVRLFRLYEGTSQIQQIVIARELMKAANAGEL